MFLFFNFLIAVKSLNPGLVYDITDYMTFFRGKEKPVSINPFLETLTFGHIISPSLIWLYQLSLLPLSTVNTK